MIGRGGGSSPRRWLFAMDQPRFVRAPTLDKYKRQQKWHLFKLQIRIRIYLLNLKYKNKKIPPIFIPIPRILMPLTLELS